MREALLPQLRAGCRRPSRRRRWSAPRSPRRGSGACGFCAERLGDLDHLPARQRQVRAPARSGSTSSQPTRASSSSARRRWARRSIRPKRRGRVGDRRYCRRPTGPASATVPGRCRRCRRALAASGPVKRDRAAVERHRALRRAGRRPEMILISVDLPAPFSPSTAWIEPRSAGEVDAAPARARRRSACATPCSSRKARSRPSGTGCPAMVVGRTASRPAGPGVARRRRAVATSRSSASSP